MISDRIGKKKVHSPGFQLLPRVLKEIALGIVLVQDLVKRYKELVALDHFNLEIEQGEVFGLLGPNGSGKTTAINCMLQLLTYEQGSIRLFGEDMEPTRYDLKRRIGIVPQNIAVFSQLTVLENIDYFCSLYVDSKFERKGLVEEAIAFVGLEEFRSFRPRKLSGGLIRRLNVACGIAHKPELIFFDEPTVAVDPQSRNAILEGIQQLNREGSTIVYTSHYMEEVEQICTRIMIMDHGKALAIGTKRELQNLIDIGERIEIELLEDAPEALELAQQLAHVVKATREGTTLRLACARGESNLTLTLAALAAAGIDYGRVFSEPPTLNDVFLEITGKELRD
ncbi:MAG: ABC transporter ATP-binding protein [Coriobacteriales bacterium]|nr:ABC transporter ATP-binding protein [Coriobacteriales bacterium]